jgi:hypothetical protein
MSSCFTLDKPVARAHDFRIRFNLEFLRGCTFECPGCYVNRKNNFNDKDLEIVKNARWEFEKDGFVFDEIILGPTDFFSALNTEDLIENQRFGDLFSQGTVLTLLSTLQSDEQVINSRIDLVNKHLPEGIEIEILIPFNYRRLLKGDSHYIESLSTKIKLLERLNFDVEYALQLNIQEFDESSHFDLKKISDLVWREFKTITEFNPSFMRLAKKERVIDIISNWNEMLSSSLSDLKTSEDNLTFTMANKNHAGFNELTFNYSDGYFYSCPFIYENVFDKSQHFKIIPSAPHGHYLLSDFMAHRNISNQNQLEYLKQTENCHSCSHAISCVSKQVVDYMLDKKITSCILAKDILDLYL